MPDDKRDCKACGERMRTRTSKPYGAEQLRYMQCKRCGNTCRCVVKASSIWRRQR
jgi:hypothetical protein